NMANALANAMCERCKSGFAPAEKIVNSNGELYHEGLRAGSTASMNFQMLFAPCCHQCGEFIIGRVIKAMNNSWHPDCFCCDLCQAVLADVGFVKNAGRHLCRPCHNREKARGLGKYICQKCHAIIEEQPLLFKNDPYHPDHFNCNNCGYTCKKSRRTSTNLYTTTTQPKHNIYTTCIQPNPITTKSPHKPKELTAAARELKESLYCCPAMTDGLPYVARSDRPIAGPRGHAMGKPWHSRVMLPQGPLPALLAVL
ncbi:unnamed protein product, partial [Coregonus sp. 'balchen']